MTQKAPLLEDIKVIAEEGDDGWRVVLQETPGPRVMAAGLPQDIAERIAATWNFCEGFSTGPLQKATLHAIMDALD